MNDSNDTPPTDNPPKWKPPKQTKGEGKWRYRFRKALAWALSVKGKWAVVLWTAVAGTVVASTIGLVLFVWVVKLYSELPSIHNLREYAPSSVTRIYDHRGETLGEYYSERRVYVPLETMPKELIQAVLSVEDTRFYDHFGVDPVRIAGAVVANFVRGGLSQGGSTITQQLARTLFLSRDKTFTRKIKEALLSLKMERILTKDEILELYLNEIYLGNGAYGVQTAAQAYFGRDIGELTLPEFAFLAGLPKAPSRYTPYVNPEAAKKRQGVVLRRMVDAGAIDWSTYQLAYATDLSFRRPRSTSRQAPYFLEEIRKHLANVYGTDAVYQGGLSVYTTLDGVMQEAAEVAVKKHLRALDKRQGWRGVIGRLSEEEMEMRVSKGPRARIRTELTPGDLYEAVVVAVAPDELIVLVEGREGIISMEDMEWARRRLTGPDLKKDLVVDRKFAPEKYITVGDLIHVGINGVEPLTFTLSQIPKVQAALVALDPASGELRAMVGGYDFNLSQFNRAISAQRESGSAFKPLVYAAAFEKGYSPASILMDTPLTFHDSSNNTTWKPENYEKRFFGATTLRDALVHSRNIASIKLLQEVGVRHVRNFSRRLGIETPLTKDLSLVLGSSSVNLMELTRAYGVFAAGGMRAEPYFLRRVVDRSGVLLEAAEPMEERAISEETAYLITNVLEDVVRKGTGRRAKVLGRHVGGKTGTTNNFTDAWFMGFAPDLAVGVWVGMDDHTSLGNKETGARAALPIWIDFLKVALKSLPDREFDIPHGIVYAKVDTETGLLSKPGQEGLVEMFDWKHRPRRMATEDVGFERFTELDMESIGQ